MWLPDCVERALLPALLALVEPQRLKPLDFLHVFTAALKALRHPKSVLLF
jgi:hypothetical protein